MSSLHADSSGWARVREQLHDSLDALMQGVDGVSSTASRFVEALREEVDPVGHTNTCDTRALAAQVEREGRTELAKAAAEKADRALARIINTLDGGLDESADLAKPWMRARDAWLEARTALSDRGWVVQVEKRWNTRPEPEPAEQFFPREWWRTLSEEAVADVIVDAFASEFCNAFVDGAILMEISGESHRPTNVSPHFAPRSGSESCLGGIPATLPYGPLSKPLDQMPPRGGRELDRSASGTVRSTQGFVQRDPPKVSHEAWMASRHHAFNPELTPFKTRITRTMEVHRPARTLRKRWDEVKTPSVEQRFGPKYVLPMTAMHFPEEWDKATRKPESANTQGGRRTSAGKSGAKGEAAAPKVPERPGLLSIGPNGKTTFPYSLASHRAFLESLHTPELKSKAEEIVPVRMTMGSSHLHGFSP